MLHFLLKEKKKDKDISWIQWYSCKQYGHIKSNYGKKFCNYCEKHEHIIKNYPIGL